MTDTLSSDVRILTVRDGQAYGRATTETGAPALMRYRIGPTEWAATSNGGPAAGEAFWIAAPIAAGKRHPVGGRRP